MTKQVKDAADKIWAAVQNKTLTHDGLCYQLAALYSDARARESQLRRDWQKNK